jgi:methylated-DNA-[protein]-cysteine S-methyltransferase
VPQISLHSSTGELTVFEEDGTLVAVEWGRGTSPNDAPTDLLQDAKRQLQEYFDGTRQEFDLPLRPAGTDFQRAVWQCMIEIPYGEARTYGDLAHDLDSAPRAVGGACGRNPIPIIIPCHRVVGAGGKLTGFSGGEGVDTKKLLLGLEQLNTSPLFAASNTR